MSTVIQDLDSFIQELNDMQTAANRLLDEVVSLESTGNEDLDNAIATVVNTTEELDEQCDSYREDIANMVMSKGEN